MFLRHLFLCLIASTLVVSCATPLTPEQQKAQDIETAKALDYFTRPVELTDDGGHSAGYTKLLFRRFGSGFILSYYSKEKIRPLYSERVTECVGRVDPSPTIDCKLYNGFNSRLGFTYTVASEDTIVTDPALIPLQHHINVKKGDLIVETRHSPQSWRFAGRFLGE